MTGRIEIFRSPERQAEGVAEWLVTRMLESHGDFRLVLSGGNTPRAMYRHLVDKRRRKRVPWGRLRIFWGDERFVPHNDPASNFGMAFGAFLGDAPIPRNRIHPIPTDGTVRDAAARYEAMLRDIRATDGATPTRPMFDVVLLGLGADGHTASLFPESPALDEKEHWVAAVEIGQLLPRITLTLPAIASSRFAAFVAGGADKQRAALGAIGGDKTMPASFVRSEGEVIWFLDRDAATPLYHK